MKRIRVEEDDKLLERFKCPFCKTSLIGGGCRHVLYNYATCNGWPSEENGEPLDRIEKRIKKALLAEMRQKEPDAEFESVDLDADELLKRIHKEVERLYEEVALVEVPAVWGSTQRCLLARKRKKGGGCRLPFGQ